MYNILIEFGTLTNLVSLIKMCLNETYSRVRGGKSLSDMFHITIGLKQGDALYTLLFDFALEYVIRRVQVNQDGLKLDGMQELFVYVYNGNVIKKKRKYY